MLACEQIDSLFVGGQREGEMTKACGIHACEEGCRPNKASIRWPFGAAKNGNKDLAMQAEIRNAHNLHTHTRNTQNETIKKE
jgi:hypothetical protein